MKMSRGLNRRSEVLLRIRLVVAFCFRCLLCLQYQLPRGNGHGFFCIGRDNFFPLALEGALKLKEISYLHAEGNTAAEMKHGPIALADTEPFIITLMTRSSLYDKIKSNVDVLSPWGSTTVAITSEYFELADDIIEIRPYDPPMVVFFLDDGRGAVAGDGDPACNDMNMSRNWPSV